MPRLPFRVETRTLLPLLAVLALAWTFWEVAEEVWDGTGHAWDERLLLALRDPLDPARPWGGPVVETVVRDITALGGALILFGTVAAVTLALVLRGQPRSAGLFVLAVAGAQALSSSIKALFDRARPDLVPHGTDALFASFPSGHTTMATAVWLLLAAMMARTDPLRSMKALYLSLAILVVLAVGVSRVYLGVHWPSDVLAGWALGAAWALGCYLLADRLGATGRIEPERDEAPPP
ncbi:phosphatase PAP2 family protein [Rubellimicrobium sp. CFH 75288]|uniref:phosphatase PAP2 family protein n=1 Tax=Rubellimicrobium sp. CFH 75288 TaxID=2697034 RepID=UPI0014125418|nr:phosphatase PAP2 family protein [Rubellimicrobium sp. CFH 75288]NAZ35610.1 phosphatase PAP2 family protein [Rubellimicrobium sp. CFH 75288]